MRHRQEQKYAAQDAQRYADEQAQYEAAAAAAPAEPDYTAELQRLATLRDQGILTPEEFAAKKAQILGL